MNPLAPALLLPLLASLLAAQSQQSLVGITLNTPLLAQNQHQACTGLGSCTPAGLLATTLPYWPGGNAYDGGDNAVWATTGQMLGKYGLGTCTVVCAPTPCPKSSPAAEATGLDVAHIANRLWVIDDAGWLTECTNACPPVVLNSYNTGLVLAGFTATTGVAVDELRGLIFYSTADFALGSGMIYVAPLATPGAWFQAVPVFDCFNNPNLVTGIAVSAGAGVLYWTNGRSTFDWAYAYTPSPPSVSFTAGTCCQQAAPFLDPYTDLSLVFGAATASGAPCANGTCPACPMLHLLRNAPILGTNLQLGLDFAPVGVPAWCLLDIGACNAATAIVPPLCGPLLMMNSGAPLTLGFQVTTGGGFCTGTTTFVLPLPANPAFAGLPLASQCLALCPPTGTTLSNCLSFVLQ